MNAASPTNRPLQSPAVTYAAVAVLAFANCLAQPSFAAGANTSAENSTVKNSTAAKTVAYQAALNSITFEELKEHVCYLADDKLQGRGPGTEGGRAAGKHIAEKFKKFKLSPGNIPPGGIPPNDGGGNSDGDYFQPFQIIYRNVLARLPGSDADLKKEVIVVGAHYDHLGCDFDVYNGADDNASGTAGLLELAEAFAMLPRPPRRTILFAAWDGEETGLRGSRHWLRHSSLGDGRIVFMFNMDMIGRLRDNKLAVYACRSGYGLRRLVSTLNSDLTLEFPRKIMRCSDHWTFYNAGIPTIMFNTGRHDELHTPCDDVELINNEGMCRVARLAFETIAALANADEITKFREASHDGRAEPLSLSADMAEKPLRLGIFWREDDAEPGTVVLAHVVPKTPAARAGLKTGDRIYRIGGKKFKDDAEFAKRIATTKGPIRFRVERAGKLREVEVWPKDVLMKQAA